MPSFPRVKKVIACDETATSHNYYVSLCASLTRAIELNPRERDESYLRDIATGAFSKHK